MSLFKGIKDTPIRETAEYFPEGKFTVSVNRVKQHEKQTGQKYFIVEFKVLDSTNPQMPAGSTAQFMETFKFIPKGLARVKQFIVAASGGDFSADDVTEEVAEMVVSEKQPLAGKTLRITTKLNEKGSFMEHNFYPAG